MRGVRGTTPPPPELFPDLVTFFSISSSFFLVPGEKQDLWFGWRGSTFWCHAVARELDVDVLTAAEALKNLSPAWGKGGFAGRVL